MGKEDAWRYLLTEFFGPMERMLVGRGVSAWDAADVVEEVCRTLLEKLRNQTVDIPESPGRMWAYLRTILRSRLVDDYRARHADRTVELENDTLVASRSTDAAMAGALLVRELMEQVPKPARSILEGHYWRGSTDREIADELNGAGVPTPSGVRWSAANVAQVRTRTLADLRGYVLPRRSLTTEC